MMKRYRLSLSKPAIADMERLQDFLRTAGDPQADELLEFVIDALDVLTHQPAIGRPFPDGTRELIIERGRSGYLALYRVNRAHSVVQIARIRHQRESGYTEFDI